MLESMSNIWQSDEVLLCFDLMIQAIKTSTNKKHQWSVFFYSPTLYGGKGKQKLLILPQGMRKRRVNALIRSVTMKAWHLYLIHRRWTYNKKQQNFILYKNSPSAFRIFDFFIFYFFEFQKIHEISWIFINCHERYPAQKMYALILFDGDTSSAIGWFFSSLKARGFVRVLTHDPKTRTKSLAFKELKNQPMVELVWVGF